MTFGESMQQENKYPKQRSQMCLCLCQQNQML
uniref:Uncharacterized protein n=1 Tax=Rhizophora mucronata TaxID=61149 RepID=A0A2P2J1U9_RHIMU